MKIGDRIRLEREKRGFSQTDLAIKSGYADKSAICKIERSGDDVSMSQIRKVSPALNVSDAYLLGWESTENDLLLELYLESDDTTKEMVKRILKYHDEAVKRGLEDVED